MKTKHTPGPWVGYQDGFKTWVKSEGEQFVADLSAQSNTAKAFADARLIAAAPDLLEAAVIAQMVLFHITPVPTTTEDKQAIEMFEKAQELLLAAILKAGEEK